MSPSSLCFEETCSTLRFADRARNIVNNPILNSQEDLACVIERKDKEICRLRQLVATLRIDDCGNSSNLSNLLKVFIDMMG